MTKVAKSITINELKEKYDLSIPDIKILRNIFYTDEILTEREQKSRENYRKALKIFFKFVNIVYDCLKQNISVPNKIEIDGVIYNLIQADKNETVEASFDTETKKDIYLTIHSVLDLLDRKYQHAILHETVHYIDAIRIDNYDSIKKIDAKDKYKYYNDPLEFNAFCNEFIFYIDKHLLNSPACTYYNSDKKDKKAITKCILSAIKEILNNNKNIYHEYLTYLSDKNLKKLYTRILDYFLSSIEENYDEISYALQLHEYKIKVLNMYIRDFYNKVDTNTFLNKLEENFKDICMNNISYKINELEVLIEKYTKGEL